MKGDLKYKIILGVSLLLLILFELLKPVPTDWRITLAPKDKIPFGTYSLEKVLPDLFSEENLVMDESSIYQILSNDSTQNLIVTAKTFSPSDEDFEQLIKGLENGNQFLIITENTNNLVSDSLHLNFNYQVILEEQILKRRDTVALNFRNKKYPYPKAFVNSQMSPFEQDYTILSKSDQGQVIFIEKKIGKGRLLICTVPLLFTNFSLLNGENHEIIEEIITQLPDQKTTWTSLYAQGRSEPTTKMRFLLSQPALKWAYFIAIGSLVIFMIFSLKREQRQIPVVKPPRNTTVEFAETVGQLYLKNGNHKDIVNKRLQYLKEYLFSKYFIVVNFEPDEYEKVVNKTGKDPKITKELFQAIQEANRAVGISREQLVAINKKIEAFYQNT